MQNKQVHSTLKPRHLVKRVPIAEINWITEDDFNPERVDLFLKKYNKVFEECEGAEQPPLILYEIPGTQRFLLDPALEGEKNGVRFATYYYLQISLVPYEIASPPPDGRVQEYLTYHGARRKKSGFAYAIQEPGPAPRLEDDPLRPFGDRLAFNTEAALERLRRQGRRNGR
jgi:hypothetical protein